MCGRTPHREQQTLAGKIWALATCDRSDTRTFPTLCIDGRVKHTFAILAESFLYPPQTASQSRDGEKFPLHGENESVQELSFLSDHRLVPRCAPEMPTLLRSSVR